MIVGLTSTAARIDTAEACFIGNGVADAVPSDAAGGHEATRFGSGGRRYKGARDRGPPPTRDHRQRLQEAARRAIVPASAVRGHDALDDRGGRENGNV